MPSLEPYIAALEGVNVTFMRGGTGVAVPLRLAAGIHQEVVSGMGVGLEPCAELGPLVFPFTARYAAVHLGLVAAWAL